MPPKEIHFGLKQASRQWYFKFDQTIRNFGFKENVEDNCVYTKFKNGKFIFLVLYVDDILLASSDVSLLLETKKMLVLFIFESSIIWQRSIPWHIWHGSIFVCS